MDEYFDEQNFELAARYTKIMKKRKPTFEDKGWLWLYMYTCEHAYPFEFSGVEDIKAGYMQLNKKLEANLMKLVEGISEAKGEPATQEEVTEAVQAEYDIAIEQKYHSVHRWLIEERLAAQGSGYGALYYAEKLRGKLQQMTLADVLVKGFKGVKVEAGQGAAFHKTMAELKTCTSLYLVNNPDTGELEQDRINLGGFIGDVLAYNTAIDLIADFLGYEEFKTFKDKPDSLLTQALDGLNALMEQCGANALETDARADVDGAKVLLPIDIEQYLPEPELIKQARKDIKDFSFAGDHGALVPDLAGRYKW